jgi:hypothetical protein
MNRLLTTRANELRALGTGGQLAWQTYAQLRQFLLTTLGPTHASLLAEPAFDSDRGTIDWYTNASGVPTVADAIVRAHLDDLLSAIRIEVARLTASDSASERLLGDLLALAMYVPNEGYVYSVAGHPVLVGWGHERASAGGERVLLIGHTPSASKPMAIYRHPATAVGLTATRRWAWLFSLVILLLMCVFLLLLWRDPFNWFSLQLADCAVPVDETEILRTLSSAQMREGELRAELARIWADAGQRRVQCRPPTPPSQPRQQLPQTPQPQQPSNLPQPEEQHARERGAQRAPLEVFLAWKSRADLDLFLKCPSGGVIWARNLSACGGRLDLDANGSGNPRTSDPVEHISITNPEQGTYSIAVANCETLGAAEPFHAWVVHRGRTIAEKRGTSPTAPRTSNDCGPVGILEFVLPP